MSSPESRRHAASAGPAPLPLCCQAWVAETAHAMQRHPGSRRAAETTDRTRRPVSTTDPDLDVRDAGAGPITW
jgi:hypothetical protein